MKECPTFSQLINAIDAANFLSVESVRRRAELLYEELPRLDIDGFRLLPIRAYPATASRPEIRVSEYEFGPVPFNLENARDPTTVRKTVVEMDGTALNREDILYLSQICEVARRIIPRLWASDAALLADVRLGSKHLDTLNEIWWLARWSGFSEAALRREVSVVQTTRKRVDWSFCINAEDQRWTINLEVKRLIGSLGARAYGKEHHFYTAYNFDGTLNTDDPRQKFRRSLDGEINLLGITWFDDISAELEAKVQHFLEEDDRIDAVLIWAPGDRRRGGWARYFPRFRELFRKRRALQHLLKVPDEEDHSRIVAFAFPRTLESIRAEMTE